MSAKDELTLYRRCVYEPGDWVEWRAWNNAKQLLRGWVPAAGLPDQHRHFVSLNGQGFGIHVGANPRKERGATSDAGVLLARTLFADLDHIDNDQQASYDEIAIGRIEAASLPMPTMRVFSGHGIHLYWRLKEPLRLDEWKSAQQRLIKTLSSDPDIKNPERMMRLPGFTNTKADPIEAFIIEANPALTFPFADLLPHLEEINPPSPPCVPSVPRADGEGDVLKRAIAFSEKWPPASEGSRNREAYVHACQLANDFGLSERDSEDILLVWNFSNYPPLPDAEIASVIKSASRHHKFTPGNKRDRPNRPAPSRRQRSAAPPAVSEVEDTTPAVDERENAPRNSNAGGQMAMDYVNDCIDGVVIDWPWPQLTEATELPAPGNVLALCGPPGSTKTFFMVQALRKWLMDDVAADMLIMEEDIEHILARSMAQGTGVAGMTSRRWVKHNPEQARQIATDTAEENDRLARHLWDLPVSDISFPGMASWLTDRVKNGSKLLIVDPITAAVQSETPWIDQGTFINGAKRLAREHGVSIILTTHPKMGQSNAITLDSLAGPAASVRFCQGVIWLEAFDQPKGLAIQLPHMAFAEDRAVNRVMHVLKARNAKGKGLRIGYWFDDSLTFSELGIVKKEKKMKKTKEESEPEIGPSPW